MHSRLQGQSNYTRAIAMADVIAADQLGHGELAIGAAVGKN